MYTVQTVKFYTDLISGGYFGQFAWEKTKIALFEIQNSSLEIKPEELFCRGAILAAQNLTV